ncbi:DNA polymerase delta subunit 3 isoform X2 [Dunckerocampus dactyliophorus]|uniref:DNA polymerase delta subunit 3 isoform X2 n=1 Tax=Dunckerocampus dactyliophorus TaxID=161453 RepID=UPI002406BA4B|nr:DNA polymerase delta subunit 3 isoform X2 [Dunckerocampus dactyliophorus]
MRLFNGMDELYLDNIDEFVNDHDTIVTYKWLSLTLGVHVNTAKQMLFHYLDHKRKESSAQLHATYLVSGKCVDNGHTSHKVSLVREDQLEDFKSKMSLIVSVHVYSVQKALLKDSGPLYAVDYDAVKDNLLNCSKYSAIRCSGAVPMSSLELHQARATQGEPPPQPESKKPSTNGEAKVTSKMPAKPTKGIMGMFASKGTAAKSQDGSEEVDLPKNKVSAKSNPMVNFFGNQSTKKQDTKVEKEEDEEAPLSSLVEQQSSSLQREKKQDTVTVEPPKHAKKDSRSKTKRLESSDSQEEKMDKKKRRRIKMSAPDSSDEDIIPDSPQPTEAREASPTPTKELQPIPHPGDSQTKIRKRRRVLKSRTFVDDEGCIVTEKGYESESYSENEDATPAASKQATTNPVRAKAPASSKDSEKKNPKKMSANGSKGTKQASIMGFFQKK